MPGRAIGTTTRSSTCHSPQPSIRAASTTESGMVSRNWRSRKMLNASPASIGRISGHSVPVSPALAHIRYSGTVTTCGGSIIMQMITTNTAFSPRHRSFASAYAAGTLDSSMNPVASTT